MEQEKKVALKKIIEEFDLKIVSAPKNLDEVYVKSTDVHRPGVQLADEYFDYFDNLRIQIIGKVETEYLKTKTSDERRKVFKLLVDSKIPAIVVTRDIEPFKELVEEAEKGGVTLLKTEENTSVFMAKLIASLNIHLAPTITYHGVLVEIYGLGVLLTGDSGIGKSETAIELVKRGHRLIADDAVEIKRVSAKTLVGTAEELIRHLIELRGIGIVDVQKIFGMGAVKETENINLVINLEVWQQGKTYERMGLEHNTTEILGIDVPSITVPVRPGRNLAIIIEVAAMNFRQQTLGYNAAEELNERIKRSMEEK